MLVKPMLSVICFRMFSWKVFFFECREGRISRVALKTATKNFRFPLDVQLSLYMYPNPMNNKIKHVYGWKKNKP